MFLLLVIAVNAHEWVNISPFYSSSYSVRGNFISEKEGWIIQDGYDIYHTDDGGLTWKIIYSLDDSNEFFTSLSMIDKENGWAKIMLQDQQYPYDNHVTYLKTIDGGHSWIDMTSNFPDVYEAYSLYFVNKDIGFFSCGSDSLDHSANIYKTVTGGDSWYLTQTPPAYSEYPYLVGYSVVKFYFLDENNGWAACSAMFDAGLSLKTSDGGESWEIGIECGPPDIQDIHFSSKNHGGAVGRNSFFSFVKITDDNFETYEYYYQSWASDMGQMAHAICFQDSSNVWITGEPGIIYHSKNGGKSFSNSKEIDATLYSIQFFNGTGYVFGTNNALYRYMNSAELPENIILYQNYPNPFNDQTKIDFYLEEDGFIEINIYNSHGQLIQNLIKKDLFHGMHSEIYNGAPLSNGIYYCSIKINGEVKRTRKMLYLK